MSAAAQKILIADDDSSIRLVLSQAFTRLGYDVRATGNATTLLKWVTDGEGDLVITDVVMPDENVFDVLPRPARCSGSPSSRRRSGRSGCDCSAPPRTTARCTPTRT